jgi:transcriptional regulator with XRE-family HTH domain
MDEHDFPEELFNLYPRDKRTVVQRIASITGGALRLASNAKGVSMRVGKALLNSPEHLRSLQETGAYLRDLREVAGLTLQDLSESLELTDESLLTAVENGTATISFELVLRLAALVARHDPIPFIMQFVRTYNPDAWEFLEAWGVDRIPIQIERERQFINIYRGHDEARTLSEEGFQKVLNYTRSAFEMALHFVAEHDTPDEPNAEAETDAEADKPAKAEPPIPDVE